MREGDIIAFAKKEVRPLRHGDRPLFDGEELVVWVGKPDNHQVCAFRPLTPAEIAAAQRTLAAVARHRPLLELFASNGIGVKEAVFAVKEILG